MSIESVIEEVKQEATKVVEAVTADVEKAVIEIKAEEKLALRDVELQWAKLQLEMRTMEKRAAEITKQLEVESAKFTSSVEQLAKTYAIDIKRYTYDAVLQVFKKI